MILKRFTSWSKKITSRSKKYSNWLHCSKYAWLNLVFHSWVASKNKLINSALFFFKEPSVLLISDLNATWKVHLNYWQLYSLIYNISLSAALHSSGFIFEMAFPCNGIWGCWSGIKASILWLLSAILAAKPKKYSSDFDFLGSGSSQ